MGNSKINSLSELPKDIIELLQRKETILQKICPGAVSLWRNAQKVLTEYPERLREPTRKLATWFLHEHLRQIRSPSDLEKVYYDPSFSDPLFQKWKENVYRRASYQTAEDVAFFWRLNELIFLQEEDRN